MEKENLILKICLTAFFVLTGILCLEYYTVTEFITQDLITDPKSHQLQGLGLKAVKVLGTLARLISLLAYPLISIFIDIQDKKGRRPQYPTPPLPLIAGCVIIFLVSWYFLITIYKQPLSTFKIVYPLAVISMIASATIAGFRFKVYFPSKYGIKTDRQKREKPESVNIQVNDNGIKGWINIGNIFQGILTFTAAGQGKTKSLIALYLDQVLKKGSTGIIYDLKFNHVREETPLKRGDLAGFVVRAFREHKITDRKLWIVNWKYMDITHRVNVFHPDYLETLAHAEGYSMTFLENLVPEWADKKQFFENSAIGSFKCALWFLKKNFPQYCTLPHIIELFLSTNPQKLVEAFMKDEECARLISSLESAMSLKAADQIAGVVSSIQIPISKLMSPNIYYILSGNDFSLNLNDPKNPGVLILGNNQQLQDAYKPLNALICQLASQLLNQPGRLPSALVFDEFTTLGKLSGIENFSNQGRENFCSLFIASQDESLVVQLYGKERTRTILSSLSNKFYSAINDYQTRKTVSDSLGTEEVQIRNTSYSTNVKGERSRSVSYTSKTRPMITADAIAELRPGEFVGSVSDSPHPKFKGRVISKFATKKIDPLRNIDSFQDPEKLKIIVEENYKKIRSDIKYMMELVEEHQFNLV